MVFIKDDERIKSNYCLKIILSNIYSNCKEKVIIYRDKCGNLFCEIILICPVDKDPGSKTNQHSVLKKSTQSYVGHLYKRTFKYTLYKTECGWIYLWGMT